MVVGARKVLEKGAGFYNVWYAAGCNLACMDEMRLHVSFALPQRFRDTRRPKVHENAHSKYSMRARALRIRFKSGMN
jgi:hypothetical protein